MCRVGVFSNEDKDPELWIHPIPNNFFGSAGAWDVPALAWTQRQLPWMLSEEMVEFWSKYAQFTFEKSPASPGSQSVVMIFSLQMVSGRCASGAMSVRWGWNTGDWKLHNHWPLVAAGKTRKWCYVDFQSQISAYAALWRAVSTDVCRKFPAKLNLKFLLLETICKNIQRNPVNLSQMKRLK